MQFLMISLLAVPRALAGRPGVAKCEGHGTAARLCFPTSFQQIVIMNINIYTFGIHSVKNILCYVLAVISEDQLSLRFPSVTHEELQSSFLPAEENLSLVLRDPYCC